MQPPPMGYGPRPGMPPAPFGYSSGPAPPMGMGGMYGGPRGGFGPAAMGPYGMPPMGYGRGMGGPMGFRGGMHPPRRRKQFVGGTLESQREWEQQNLCCFYLQGLCKFGERCRYSHDDDGTKGCQFGLSCRVGHASRSHASSKPMDGQPMPPQ